MHKPRLRSRSAAAIVALSLALAACSTGGGSEAADTTTTADETPTTAEETTTTEAEPEPEPEPEDDEIEGGLIMVGDKSVLLDGFVGVEIPAGWSITSTEVPLLSASPADETELDVDALTQSLVINPDDEPRGASFALVHYEHSDLVPNLALFSESIIELLSGDGSEIGEASTANIGGQDAALYQVKTPSGANGVLITLETGGEYFFIISIVTETSFSEDAGAMLASVSFVPETLHD